MDITKYYIHPDYQYSKKIKEFICDLIIDYKYESYHCLAKSDKYKLASIISEQDSGLTEELEFMVHDDAHYLMDLFRKCLISQNQNDKDLFMEEMKNSAVKYYDKLMEKLFNYHLERIIELENAA